MKVYKYYILGSVEIEAEGDSEAHEEIMYVLQGISEIDNPIIQNVDVSDILEDDE